MKLFGILSLITVIVIFVVMTRDVVSGYGTLVLIGSYDHVQ
jgi:hypothetical protein